MRGFASSRTGFAARRPRRSPQQLRADWTRAILLARALARAAAAAVEPTIGFGQDLTRLAATLRGLEPANFPIEADSARSMATAFLKLARDFCHPGWPPPARTACADFLAAGAGCLDGLISELTAREAALSRRITGERDED